ncbi:MAG: EI24 domain-containing protein [Erythrobacter sp.]|nr:EI24 domain-containing protein [Erythrobacter sp.]
MISLPRALALSFSQLGDPAILKVLGKSLLITLAIFLLLGWGLSFGFEAALEWAGLEEGSDAGTLLAVLATLIGAWLLFRFVALFVLQFFVEEVVRAVEARHYPEAASAARSLAFHEEMRNGVRSTMRALLVNLVALPFAILLLVTGIGTALLFWAVNAFLLGRELQDMVWLRHRRDTAEIAPLGQGRRFLLGGAVAALLMVPFLNLLAPVLGAASATHLVHRRRAALA